MHRSGALLILLGRRSGGSDCFTGGDRRSWLELNRRSATDSLDQRDHFLSSAFLRSSRGEEAYYKYEREPFRLAISVGRRSLVTGKLASVRRSYFFFIIFFFYISCVSHLVCLIRFGFLGLLTIVDLILAKRIGYGCTFVAWSRSPDLVRAIWDLDYDDLGPFVTSIALIW